MKGMKKSNSITNIASTNHSKEHEKNRESGIKSLARVYDGNQKWLNNNTSLSYPIFASSSFLGFLQKFITGHLSSPSLSKFSYFWSNYWNDNVKYVSQKVCWSLYGSHHHHHWSSSHYGSHILITLSFDVKRNMAWIQMGVAPLAQALKKEEKDGDRGLWRR